MFDMEYLVKMYNYTKNEANTTIIIAKFEHTTVLERFILRKVVVASVPSQEDWLIGR